MSKFDEFIEVKGARVHNLKNIDVKIPREQLVVITGMSGSRDSVFPQFVQVYHRVSLYHCV